MAHTPESRAKAYAKMKRRKAEYFAGKCCKECGSTFNLELDHVNPEEKVSHNVWSWSEPRLAAELEKCQVLCGKCHSKKTSAYLKKIFSKPISHGTATAYYHKGCRCEKCREARKSQRTKLRLRNGHW